MLHTLTGCITITTGIRTHDITFHTDFKLREKIFSKRQYLYARTFYHYWKN